MDSGAWQATVHRITQVGHNLATKPPPSPIPFFTSSWEATTIMNYRTCFYPYFYHTHAPTDTSVPNQSYHPTPHNHSLYGQSEDFVRTTCMFCIGDQRKSPSHLMGKTGESSVSLITTAKDELVKEELCHAGFQGPQLGTQN